MLHKRILKTAKAFLLPVLCCILLCACDDPGRRKEIDEFSARYGVPSDSQLIVYTSHKEEVYLPIISEFENRTGIWVEVHAGGTIEMLSEIRQNAESGDNCCDIMFGGGIEAYAANKGLFVPFAADEKDHIAEEFCSSEDLWTPFTELPIVFIYNNKLVSQEDAPKGWADLFDNRWKGLISFADPTNSGSSYTILNTMLLASGQTPEEFIPRFIEQLDIKTEHSSGDVIPSVSNGKYLVGITLEETALKYMDENSDISMIYPAEGTSAVPDGCAIVSGAPHRANAEKFINFITGMETQRYAIEQFHRRTVRNDIDTSLLYTDIPLIEYDIAQAGNDAEKILSLWKKTVDRMEEP